MFLPVNFPLFSNFNIHLPVNPGFTVNIPFFMKMFDGVVGEFGEGVQVYVNYYFSAFLGIEYIVFETEP